MMVCFPSERWLLLVWAEWFGDFLFLSHWNCQSAEDVIAEQAKQEEEDPFVNLSKKEKKKKKKQVKPLHGARVHVSFRTAPKMV